MKRLALFLLLLASPVFAVDAPIVGTVEPKCSVWVETNAVYGSPLPYKLSTLPNEGGVKSVIRIDVAQANYYKARFTWPNSFVSSPPLNDSVTFTGETVIGQVSDSNMSNYPKTTYNNVTEFSPLSIAGSTWFVTSSTASYGSTKALPSGTYVANIKAECIAL